MQLGTFLLILKIFLYYFFSFIFLNASAQAVTSHHRTCQVAPGTNKRINTLQIVLLLGSNTFEFKFYVCTFFLIFFGLLINARSKYYKKKLGRPIQRNCHYFYFICYICTQEINKVIVMVQLTLFTPLDNKPFFL